MFLSDFFQKISAQLSALFQKIRNPSSLFRKRWPEVPLPGKPKLCKLCYPNGDPDEWGIPDDIRDIKLKKDNQIYDIKLDNLPPEKWKIVGRNLLNMAYTDPQFGKQFDDDTDDEDELPPPPEPSAEIKAMKTPLISVNVKGLNVVSLEDLGDMFYEIADMVGRSKDDMGNEPTCAVLAEEQEAIEEAFFDVDKKLSREMKKNIKITNSEVIPGLPPQRYRSDEEDWFNFMEMKHRFPRKLVEEDDFKNWPGISEEPPTWRDFGGEDTGLVYNDVRGNNEEDSDIGDVGVPVVTHGVDSFKGTCSSIRNRYDEVKQGWAMVKTIFKLAKKIDSTKFAETKDPKDLVGAFADTEEMPEALKSVMSTIDPDSLAKMTKIMYDSFTKKGINSNGQPTNENVNEKSDFNMDNFRKMTDTFLGSTKKPTGHSAESNSRPDFESRHRYDQSDDAAQNVKEAASIHSSLQDAEGVNSPDNELNSDFNQREEMQPKLDLNEPEINDSAGAKTQNENPSSFENKMGIDYSPEDEDITSKSSKLQDDPDFIRSASYKEIMSMSNSYENKKEKKNMSQKMHETFKQNQTSGQSSNQGPKKDVHPMKKMLAEELQKKFGPNWKQRIPPFVANPAMETNIPDLGLGLDKAGNRDMVIQMSKVLKDLM